MEVSQERDILAITTTVGKLEEAQALARELVERRLAACVQVDPGVLSQASNANANSRALKVSRSSSCSPTPMK
jgi:uncharacterized protein involved in tolerance to divalent cations